jgi:hypothetical protein
MKLQILITCIPLVAFPSPSSAQQNTPNYSPIPGYVIPAADMQLSPKKRAPLCAGDEENCDKTPCCPGYKCVWDVDNQVHACEDDLIKGKSKH